MKKMKMNNQLRGLIILNQKLNLQFELRIQTCKLYFIKFIAKSSQGPHSLEEVRLVVDGDKNCFFINEFDYCFKIEQINNDNFHIKSQSLDKYEDYKFYISIAK